MDEKIKIIVALWFFQLANYLDRVAISFAGPALMADLSMDTATFGIVLSSFGIGYCLAQIPGGMLADRWGARPLLIVAPLFWALFTGMTGLAVSVGSFVIIRLCFGLSEGSSNTACYKVIGDHFDAERRPRAFGLWLTAFAIGPALAGPAAGFLLHAYGWRTVFWAMMLPALAAALINALLIPPSAKPIVKSGQPDPTRAFVEVLRQPALWFISACYFGFNLAYWGYLSWMPSYLAHAHQIDIKALGILGGIPYLGAFVGVLIAGWLAAGPCRHHRTSLLAVFYAGAAVALFLSYHASSLPLALTSLTGTAFFLYGGLSPFGAIVLDLAPPSCRAAYSGVINTTGQIGGALAPFLVGTLVKFSGSFSSGFALMDHRSARSDGMPSARSPLHAVPASRFHHHQIVRRIVRGERGDTFRPRQSSLKPI